MQLKSGALCKNDGVCVTKIDGRDFCDEAPFYQCQCSDGWEGSDCSIKVRQQSCHVCKNLPIHPNIMIHFYCNCIDSSCLMTLFKHKMRWLTELRFGFWTTVGGTSSWTLDSFVISQPKWLLFGFQKSLEFTKKIKQQVIKT